MFWSIIIDARIRHEKILHDINRKAAKISALSSVKIDKSECFTGKETLPFEKTRIIEQPRFTYSPLGKGFRKQVKTIESQSEKLTK